jgi:catechol 2,3-dioxygenase-like lactoylglutathione lyase family enzyme
MDRQLHNVTIYVAHDDMERACAFYRSVFGAAPFWEEPGHIACFGTAELAVCVHEEEGAQPAGTHELFLWDDDLVQAEADLNATLADVRRVTTPEVDEELRATDPWGNRIRIHPRRPRA